MEGNSGLPPSSNVNNNNSPDIKTHVVYKSETDPLWLRVIPSSDYALKGIVNSMQVLFQIKTEKLEEEEIVMRQPIDIAIVLDRSGSMSGEKIKHSKQAIQQMIENLAPHDTVHFVTYDTTAEVVFEKGDLSNKETLLQMVETVMPRGNTNLSAGVELAASLLEKYGVDGHTKRIYLFSDGLANEGLRTHTEIFNLITQIHEKKISTSTFGIGTDFDEDLMKGISEYGHSYYFYIQEAAQIERFVSTALGALLGVLGKDAVLKIRGKNGCVVSKIHNYDITKGAIIGDIKQSNTKNILVEINFTPDSKVEEEEILAYELSYIHRKDSKEVNINGVVMMRTTDDDSKLQIKNSETIVASTVQRSTDFDSEIEHVLKAGNSKRAIELKQQEITLLKEILPLDNTGRIAILLTKAEKSLKDLKESGNSMHNMKQAKYHAKLKREDSYDYMAM